MVSALFLNLDDVKWLYADPVSTSVSLNRTAKPSWYIPVTSCPNQLGLGVVSVSQIKNINLSIADVKAGHVQLCDDLIWQVTLHISKMGFCEKL